MFDDCFHFDFFISVLKLFARFSPSFTVHIYLNYILLIKLNQNKYYWTNHKVCGVISGIFNNFYNFIIYLPLFIIWYFILWLKISKIAVYKARDRGITGDDSTSVNLYFNFILARGLKTALMTQRKTGWYQGDVHSLLSRSPVNHSWQKYRTFSIFVIWKILSNSNNKDSLMWNHRRWYCFVLSII